MVVSIFYQIHPCIHKLYASTHKEINQCLNKLLRELRTCCKITRLALVVSAIVFFFFFFFFFWSFFIISCSCICLFYPSVTILQSTQFHYTTIYLFPLRDITYQIIISCIRLYPLKTKEKLIEKIESRDRIQNYSRCRNSDVYLHSHDENMHTM